MLIIDSSYKVCLYACMRACEDDMFLAELAANADYRQHLQGTCMCMYAHAREDDLFLAELAANADYRQQL
jgi:hypothetical protein